jgi:flagellin-like hook-associated protein FlgL
VTADLIFASGDGTIFATLEAASAALRGTGDPVADEAALKTALDQLGTFTDQASVARTTIGKSLNAIESARDRSSQTSLALEESASSIESVDFAKASTDLIDAERALEAVLQTGSHTGRRSLLDLLG